MRAASNHHRVLVLSAWALAIAVAAYSLFARLGHAAWQTDEPVYRNAAVAIFEYGNWSHNLEHPLVGKYLIGISQAAFGETAWAARLPAAVSTLLAGLVLAALAHRILRSIAPRAASWAALATFVTWTLLPHPDPSFDVSRLAYLDAPMTLFLAGAMYAAWRWQEHWSWRWAAATGVAAGLAVATKIPALFLAAALVVLLVARPGVSRKLRGLQFAAIALIAAATALVTWLPLGSDLPRALRFLAAMQRRDVSQTLEVAGRTYRDGAPLWTQAWWQWDAWPAFALVQLAALILVWWLLPRRAAAFIVACIMLPALAYAIGGGRILPHWQATWQPAMALLVGLVAVALARIERLRPFALMGAAVVLAVVAMHSAQRTRDVASLELSDQQRVATILRPADRAGALVESTAPAARVERSLIRALPSNWDGLYHSAAYSQHSWVKRDGGRPMEPKEGARPQPPLAADNPVGAFTAFVTRHDAPVPARGLQSHDVGPFSVRVRSAG